MTHDKPIKAKVAGKLVTFRTRQQMRAAKDADSAGRRPYPDNRSPTQPRRYA